MQVSEFRVQGSGFGVEGAGFRVHAGFGVKGLRLPGTGQEEGRDV